MTQPKIPYQHRELCSDSLWGAGDQMNSCGVLYWSSVWEYTWTTAIVPLLPAENYHLSFLDDVVYIKSKFSGKTMFARPVDQTVQGNKEHREWCVSRYSMYDIINEGLGTSCILHVQIFFFMHFLHWSDFCFHLGMLLKKQFPPACCLVSWHLLLNKSVRLKVPPTSMRHWGSVASLKAIFLKYNKSSLK